jgi:hypothetical protein
MNRNLGFAAVTTVPIAATAAGTTTLNGSSQYIGAGMYQGVRYICVLGALTATQQTVLKIQGSLDGTTNWTDLAGTHAGPPIDADSGYTLITDCYRPGFPYVRPVVVRGTANAVIQCVIGDFYLSNLEPVTPDPTTADLTVTAYPQGGTA